MEENSSTGFNYFVRDVCILLLKWESFTPSAEDASLTSRLVAYLMKHAVYTNTGVRKANLQLIRLLVQRWREVLTIDKVWTYEQMYCWLIEFSVWFMSILRMKKLQRKLIGALRDLTFLPRFWPMILNCLTRGLTEEFQKCNFLTSFWQCSTKQKKFMKWPQK